MRRFCFYAASPVRQLRAPRGPDVDGGCRIELHSSSVLAAKKLCRRSTKMPDMLTFPLLEWGGDMK